MQLVGTMYSFSDAFTKTNFLSMLKIYHENSKLIFQNPIFTFYLNIDLSQLYSFYSVIEVGNASLPCAFPLDAAFGGSE